MPDDSALRAQHHAYVQSSSGLHNSNATSHQVLSGQQHRPWMAPIQSLQSLFSEEQDNLPNTTAQQAQQANRITSDLDRHNSSETACNGLGHQLGGQLPEANRIIGADLNGTSHHTDTAEQNPIQILPNKRPRLEAQPHSIASKVSEGQPALYNFVSLPVYSPSIEGLHTHPPQTTTTSPRITAGPSNISPSYAAGQALMSRRQSSLSNMGMSLQQSMQPAPTTKIAPSMSLHSVHQPITTRHTSSMMLLPRVQAAVADPLTGPIFKEEWGSRRFLLLDEACKSADWFYLTLHQVYCWRTIKGEVVSQLGLVGTREAALINLEPLLLPNTKLSFAACDWFSRFPTNQESLLVGSNPEALKALEMIRIMLDKMSLHWPQLQEVCRARRFPLSPYELYETLGMSSTVLQEVFFTFLLRQIEGFLDEQWIDRARDFFKFTQKQLIDKLTRINEGRPETPLNTERAVAQFGKDYFDLRRQRSRRPGSAGNPSIVQNTVHTSTALESPTVLSPSPNAAATFTLSQNPNHSVPPLRASQTPASRIVSEVHTDVARNIPTRTTSVPQPVARVASNTPSSIGPRQQIFMQETLGVQAAGEISVHNMGRRAPDFDPTSVSGALRNVQNSSTGARPPPGLISSNINGRPTTSSNGVSVTRQINHPLPEGTPLLPPAGKPMAQNTHPNPDLLALHQARLTTPEPVIPKVGENSPDIAHLFLVFQRFVLTPQLITKQQSYYSWQIDIPEVDIFRTALDVTVMEKEGRPATKTKREYRRGSFVYRLRCIKLTSGLHEADWAIAPTFWPASCFISLGAQEIELRRKSHWGRNLACDLTRGIKAGPNIIEMSVHFSPEEMSDTYAIAIELIEVLDHSQCTGKLMLFEAPKSLAAIVASLNTAASDDDVAIVDPHISIDLIDPFTAQIWKVPVRGKTCTHRECFDLDAFLGSRPNKHAGVPLSSADKWKCPICNKDARPQCLVLDGFLLSVSKQLRAGSDEGQEVRAIQVTADGFWKPLKAENKDVKGETSVTDNLANTTSAGSTPSLNASKETVLGESRQGSVVVIDPDDC